MSHKRPRDRGLFLFPADAMSISSIQSKNFRSHVLEGALYISTTAFLSHQTILPALIQRLGGSDVVIGAWPVVIYIVFYLPQVISANNSGLLQFRKPTVLRLGLIQRFHILAIACAVAFWGNTSPSLALVVLFLLYISNQLAAGYVSPVWMDFLAKTTSPENRGRLTGWRTSFAAILGLINGFILTLLMSILPFPYNYASAIGISFFYQMFSLLVQRKIVETEPSAISPPVRLSSLFGRMKTIVSENRLFRKFLIASSFVSLSFSAAAFFTVSAIKQFSLSESAIGIFAVFTVIGQILSGVIIGWIADLKGSRIALIICAASLVVSIALVLFAGSILWLYAAFFFFGINFGAEQFMRYNFAIECAPDGDRPMYIGIMNACLAPFYLVTPLAGWLSTFYGYNIVFSISLPVGIMGMVLLWKMEDLQRRTAQKINL